MIFNFENYTLSDDEIELQRKPSPLGTAIRVRITKETFQRLAGEYDSMRPKQSWDWFCLDRPRIVCRVRRDNDIEVREQKVKVSLDGVENSEWRIVRCDNFERVIWRPAEESWRHRLYTNGILVAAWHYNFDRNWFSSVPELKQPDVLVIDPSSNLELRLTRDDVVGEPSYRKAVQRDALLDHCAWLLSQAGTPPKDRTPFEAPMWEKEKYMSPGDGVVSGPSYIVTENGLVPFTPWHLHRADVRKLTVYFTSTNSYFPGDDNEKLIHFSPTTIFNHDLLPTPYASMVLNPFGGFGPISHINIAIDEFYYFMKPILGPDAQWVLILPANIANRLNDKSLRCSQQIGERLMRTPLTPSDDAWILIRFGAADPDVSPLASVILQPNSPIQSNNAIRGFAQFTLRHTQSAPEDELAKIWLELGLPYVLPFEASRRRELCAKAESELLRHTARYS